jgi:hypothetical protein
MSEIGRLRLVAQRIAGPGEPTVLDVARRLGAAQAQDLPGVIASLALRTDGRSRQAVTAAFDAGEIVRTWPMRGTLHVVPAEDARWMVALGSPRPMAAAAKRRSQLGLDDADLRTAQDVALATVPATREELFAAWEAAGLAPAKGRGYHLLVDLAHRGVLCFGPTRAGDPVIVAVEDWIPTPGTPDPDEAMAHWALSYFRGHGPATVADFARWTGVPMAAVRAAVAAARPSLATMTVEGTEYLLDPETPDRLAALGEQADEPGHAGAVHLLPGFDEFVLGYADRSAVLDPAHAEKIVPGSNGMFRPTVVDAGRVVGTWRVERARFAVEPFEAEPDPARVATARERYPER